jgi:hypothetical protein
MADRDIGEVGETNSKGYRTKNMRLGCLFSLGLMLIFGIIFYVIGYLYALYKSSDPQYQAHKAITIATKWCKNQYSELESPMYRLFLETCSNQSVDQKKLYKAISDSITRLKIDTQGLPLEMGGLSRATSSAIGPFWFVYFTAKSSSPEIKLSYRLAIAAAMDDSRVNEIYVTQLELNGQVYEVRKRVYQKYLVPFIYKVADKVLPFVEVLGEVVVEGTSKFIKGYEDYKKNPSRYER